MRKIGKCMVFFLILIWFFASMGAMFYLAQKKEYSLVAVIAGQFLLILGMGSMFTTVAINSHFYLKEQIGSLMSSVAGIGILCGGIIYPYYETKKTGEIFLQGISMVLFLVMTVIGLVLFVIERIKNKKRKEKCTYTLKVRCVEVYRRRDSYIGNGTKQLQQKPRSIR